METYNYNFPTAIRFGPGVIKELPQHLIGKRVKTPLLVTDPGCVSLPFFEEIKEDLESAGLRPAVFYQIDKNPVKSNVDAGKAAFHEGDCDAIIGIGGGASMDVARAIALLAYHPGELFDYEEGVGGDKYITAQIPYFVCVPTTSGTGSEVGRSAIISDDKTHQKKILFSPRLLASQVFADPLLTMDLPPHVTAATGMDALTHNIEAYCAKGFHPLCDGIALEGIRLIAESLVEATHQPTVEARSKMMIASLMGAVAFQKGLGVVHSTAHPLSTVYDIHHGLANALMLPHGVKFNQAFCPDRMNAIAQTMGTSDLVAYLHDLNAELKLPAKLTELGVAESEVDRLVDLASQDFCLPCNPCPVSKEQLHQIYEEAL